MDIEYDTDKSRRNITIRGISFELARSFELETALIWQDTRHSNEKRFIALGNISHRLHSLVFTPRGEVLRVISLRKANAREVKKYETYKTA